MAKEIKVLLVGVPCPLCGASTHVWVEDMEKEIVQKIQRDFSRWTTDAGACEQCIEAYRPLRLI